MVIKLQIHKKMDARKASSLSTASDGSDSSLHSVMNLVLEQICLISLERGEEDTGIVRSVSSWGNYISVLCGDNKVWVAELRLRPDTSDCPPPRVWVS